MIKNSWHFTLWFLLTMSIIGFYSFTMFASEDRSPLLIGKSSSGHYQIELMCESCHTESFSDTETLQAACINCHGEELKMAQDSHPKSKFTNPRNADRIEIIDARYCITCHVEHSAETTNKMGLTLPEDYCTYCHQDIFEERETHKDTSFKDCASSGCHNYHDNRAVYESFLVKHANEPWLKTNTLALNFEAPKLKPQHLNEATQDFADQHPIQSEEWQLSLHSQVNVNCNDCHKVKTDSDFGNTWNPKPNQAVCEQCHQDAFVEYKQSRHGMRLLVSSTNITPGEARLEFTEASKDNEHSCLSCHPLHQSKPRFAGLEACLECHADQHSLQFEQSNHAQLIIGKDAFQQDINFSCATCHMPFANVSKMTVQHNQNSNLRPNEKMVREVCLPCHSLQFTLDALADPALIENNFIGSPSQHIPSINWALSRTQSN